MLENASIGSNSTHEATAHKHVFKVDFALLECLAVLLAQLPCRLLGI